MDGHLENWAGDLISVLKKIKPEELNEITPLLMFMTDDNCNFSGDGEWNCEVEVIDNKYEITIYKHGEMIFLDSLGKFESEYNFM